MAIYATDHALCKKACFFFHYKAIVLQILACKAEKPLSPGRGAALRSCFGPVQLQPQDSELHLCSPTALPSLRGDPTPFPVPTTSLLRCSRQTLTYRAFQNSTHAIASQVKRKELVCLRPCSAGEGCKTLGLSLGWRVPPMGTQARWPPLGLGAWALTEPRAAGAEPRQFGHASAWAALQLPHSPLALPSKINIFYIRTV